MQYDLKDKVIIITGANSGIGKAAAIQMAQCGANVVMACRSLERGAKPLALVSEAQNWRSCRPCHKQTGWQCTSAPS